MDVEKERCEGNKVDANCESSDTYEAEKKSRIRSRRS
jgi:hypothetical protein